ncbi:transposable element Tcb1 transposase [Trichonephila clavipes]|nr:transposable element Tcb1 transposase [Trichonephila clavipes]
MTPFHRRLCLDWYPAQQNWTAAEWNKVVFSNESRFNLSSDDNRVRVWRPRGGCLNPVFALQRHTAPTTNVMEWGANVYNTRVDCYEKGRNRVNKVPDGVHWDVQARRIQCRGANNPNEMTPQILDWA